MGEFFKPIRRKFGVVTLLMACLLMAGWLRSFSISDDVVFANNQWVSVKGSLFWQRLVGVRRVDYDMGFHYGATDRRSDVYNGPTYQHYWQWRRWGFAFGEEEVEVASANGKMLAAKAIRYFIPFWSIVIPLTLVSLWLLLPKTQHNP